MQVELMCTDTLAEGFVGNFERAESLEDIAFGAGDPLRDIEEIFGRVDAGDDGGTKFIRHTGGHQQFHGLLEAFDGDGCDTGCERILFLAVLDIHRPKVHQTRGEERFHLVGEDAVGIELDEKAKVFDTADEVEQVGVQGGLAAGNDHALEQSLAGREKFEKLLFAIDGEQFRGTARDGSDELGVVAIGATKRATGREHDSGQVIRVVDKGERFEASDTHRIDKSRLRVYNTVSYQ